jgi:cytochrome P450
VRNWSSRDFAVTPAPAPCRSLYREATVKNMRLVGKPGEMNEPRIEWDGAAWRIRSLPAARQILRARHRTTQAGFTAEQIPHGFFRHRPILISDTELHDEQRRKVARFFAPTVIADRYSELMESNADSMVAEVLRAGRCRVDDLALRYSVVVTAEIVGLTSSSTQSLSRRLASFFRQPPLDRSKPNLGRSRRQWMAAAFNGLVPVLRFYLADVRPAIRDHRHRPRQDVISHLLEEGYSHPDILVECVTYGTAGMVTTREFIAMACWHLLRDARLRDRYLTAPSDERISILHEIIRLEPVVGHLYRRVRGDFSFDDHDDHYELGAGDLVDIDVRQANADSLSLGDDPLDLCPGRPLPRGVNEAVLSFSDGAHRCPGQPLAILEADHLLTRILALGPKIESEPTVSWDDLTESYRLRGFEVTFDSASPSGRGEL